jgi:NarL family two-component system sensor histidine kinase YdfH
MQKARQKGSFSRWFLILCISLIYAWVFWQRWIAWQAPVPPKVRGRFASFISTPLFDPTLASTALFSVFLTLHMSLYWIGLSPARRRWYVPYFALQGLLASGLALFWEGDYLVIALCLYLTLIGEAIIIVRQISLVVGMVVGYLALLALGQWISFNETKVGLVDWSFYLMLVLPLIPFGVGYVQTRAHERDQRLLHELEVAHTQLKAYAAQVEDLTLITERQRMARELHDTLAQGLAGVILQLEVANAHLLHQRTARAQQIVVQAMGRARDALADARRAIDDLHAQDASPDDFPEAIQEEIIRFSTATGIACTTDLTGLAQTPASLSEHILRTITEGLANVARHAQACQVWVQVTICEGGLQVEIRDDGIGFEPSVVSKRAGHYGLLGLRERARLAGGSFEITSAPGEGTTLRLHLPGKQGEYTS